MRNDIFKAGRLYYVLVFALLFILIGYFLPRLYLQYLDPTHYINVLDQVTFDKKIYKPCETQKALTKIKISINTPVHVDSRLYLIKVNPNNTEIIKSYSVDTFLQKQTQPQIFLINNPLPCNLTDGTYFYRGLYEYQILGVLKTEPFSSEEFSIKR